MEGRLTVLLTGVKAQGEYGQTCITLPL